MNTLIFAEHSSGEQAIGIVGTGIYAALVVLVLCWIVLPFILMYQLSMLKKELYNGAARAAEDAAKARLGDEAVVALLSSIDRNLAYMAHRMAPEDAPAQEWDPLEDWHNGEAQ